MAQGQKIKLKDAPAAIRARQAFESGHLRGSTGASGAYTVWSYHEAVAGWAADVGWWVATATKPTATTAAHMRTVRRALENEGTASIYV